MFVEELETAPVGDDPGVQHQRAIRTVPPKRLDPPEDDGKGEGDFVKYVGPGIVVLCILALAVMFPYMAVLVGVCLAIFAPCVVLHELAHLITAKRAGMQIEEFSIGFGQRLYSWKWRDITWSLKLFPLGGAVEITGMTVEDVERNGIDPQKAFIYKRPRTRLWVVLSGVLTNALLAWVGLSAAVIFMLPAGSPLLLYLSAPLQSIIVLGELIALGTQALATAALDWTDPNIGSILSVPHSFAEGASATLDEGLPLMAYAALFFAALNISLALFNTLPLYPLDGYHGATALVDQFRRVASRVRRTQFAPLTTWRMRWVSRSTGAFLAMFVGSVFVRDIIRMM